MRHRQGENMTGSGESRSDSHLEASILAEAAPLESILRTEDLRRRPARPPDYEKENTALVALAGALADSPRTILQTLADKVLAILDADSAGLSLLTKDKKRFYWAAIAGAWRPHIAGGTPRDFGPCGDVLDCNVPMLFTHWERRYPYLSAAVPLADEGLLVPFHVDGEAVGTIWAIAHSDSRKFDAEDLRLLESMGRFASAAYQTVESIENLKLQMAAREKAEDELRELTESLEAQVRVRTEELEQRNKQLADAEAEARIHAEQLQAISQRMVEIQETERRNLAAELHDRLGQDLTVINLNLHLVKDQLSAGSRTKAGPRLDDSIALVEHTVEVVRDVAGALRPLVLDDYGLAVTLRSYGEQFAARTGIGVTVAAELPVPRLQQDAEMALFRIGQEALVNVLKHAKATTVRLTLAVDAESVSLTIADDGCGFDAQSAMDDRTRGLGLLIMQERLRAVDGSLRIESRPGAGTSVMAKVRRAR
jgi:signal transduction histidine kinase